MEHSQDGPQNVGGSYLGGAKTGAKCHLENQLGTLSYISERRLKKNYRASPTNSDNK